MIVRSAAAAGIGSPDLGIDALVAAGARQQARAARVRSLLLVNGGRAALLVGAVAVWETSVRLGWIDQFFVGRPSAIAAFLWEQVRSGVIISNIGYTLGETFLGFALGSGAGILSGLLLARFSTVEKLVDPYLTALNTLPRIALAPLFILWFGIGSTSKVALAVSLVYFIALISTRAGVKNADEDLLTVARLIGCTGRQRFTRVLLPICVPSIFAGLRLSAIYALMAVVVAEMLGAPHGLGQELAFYAGTFQVSGVFGVLVVLAVVSMLVAGALARLERWLLRWQRLTL